MSNVTLRVPPEMKERVRRVAVRDYCTESQALRRLLRLGLDDDERREGGNDSRQPCQDKAS